MSYNREHDPAAIPLLPIAAPELEAWITRAPARHQRWLKSSRFEAKPGQWCALPGDDGEITEVVFGMENDGWLYQLAGLPASLPAANYRLVSIWNEDQRIQASLGWGLGSYRFERYKSASEPRPVLCLEDDIASIVERMYDAQALVRDLVNTPTEDMGPGELASAVTGIADEFGARIETITGDDLLTEDFPAVHAVGRAAQRAPRMICMSWGERKAPLLALVGKGVCFDTGGLDLKTAAGMKLMKKDMGGAAHALALARLVMQYELPVRLLLLIPAVENSVAGNAYRPGDVVHTRKGLSVEIGNTDAEGRVILADGLAYACEHGPDLIIDFATLTGAARVALGPDLPPIFSNHLEIAQSIADAGERVEDPVWVMPLYQPYRKMLKSGIADLNNISNSNYGGCITAALFLEHFVTPETHWVHIDTFAWNQNDRPGRPTGGEAIGMRAVFNYLRERYG